jgi:ribose 5-phosphate isomerase B
LRVAVASDHGGFELKKTVIHYLKSQGIEYRDYGTHSTESCDYPDIAQALAQAVADGTYNRGILICGTGIGVSIVANKVPGIRAALCHDTFSAHASREHNDANVLAMGERVIGPGLARDIVKVWLETGFEGGCHSRRVDKITGIEETFCSGKSL